MVYPFYTSNMAFIFGVPGSSGGSLTAGGTVGAGNTLAVTTADKLTVGGVIVPQTKTVVIGFDPNISAALQRNTVLIADEAYQITSIKVVWDIADTAGHTLSFEKLTGTTAPGSGTTVLSSSIATDGTANTVTTAALTGTTATLQLAVGNRLGWVFSNLPTDSWYNFTVTLKRI